MVRLYRRLRRKLIDEGNLKRYLIYAVGEILLIVIGILIALQISEWQIESLNRRSEIKMLEELRVNLIANENVLNDLIEQEKDMIDRVEYIFDHFQAKKEMDDSLLNNLLMIMWKEELQIVNVTYETLKSRGIDLISSDTLRVTITRLFEVDYPKEINWLNSIANAQLTSFEYPMLLQHFTRLGKIEKTTPIDFDKLRLDHSFRILLASEQGFKNAILLRAEALLKKTHKLIVMIEEEIQNLK